MMMAPMKRVESPTRLSSSACCTAGLVEVFHSNACAEILSEEVRRSGLQRFAIAHHCFDGISNVGAGEFSASDFFPESPESPRR